LHNERRGQRGTHEAVGSGEERAQGKEARKREVNIRDTTKRKEKHGQNNKNFLFHPVRGSGTRALSLRGMISLFNWLFGSRPAALEDDEVDYSACERASAATIPTRESTEKPRRLVVLSDGTWQRHDQKDLSNVGLLDRILKGGAVGDGDRVQHVFYDAGVGTGWFDRLRGGGLGIGIDTNIKQCYSFLVENWKEGDEVYMFGWSRGAYTVRSLCGMISEVGLLRKERFAAQDIQELVDKAYALYRSNDPEREREHREQHGEPVSITVLGCFDTVGALGIPRVLPGSRLLNRKYDFHNTVVSEHVRLALHALAVDERKKGFLPTRMESSGKGGGVVVQKWFPGDHGGVGGGSIRSLSAIPLKFMIDQMHANGFNLEFRDDLVPTANPLVDYSVEWSILNLVGTGPRDIQSTSELHESVLARYSTPVPDCKPPEQRKPWRPESLARFHDQLLADVQQE